jgi:excisionase family DNA binding protein
MPNHDLMTIQEAAVALRVSVTTMRRWTKEGGVPIVPLPGRTIRVRRADVEALLAPAIEAAS